MRYACFQFVLPNLRDTGLLQRRAHHEAQERLHSGLVQDRRSVSDQPTSGYCLEGLALDRIIVFPLVPHVVQKQEIAGDILVYCGIRPPTKSSAVPEESCSFRIGALPFDSISDGFIVLLASHISECESFGVKSIRLVLTFDTTRGWSKPFPQKSGRISRSPACRYLWPSQPGMDG